MAIELIDIKAKLVVQTERTKMNDEWIKERPKTREFFVKEWRRKESRRDDEESRIRSLSRGLHYVASGIRVLERTVVKIRPSSY
jgi:hypothetical protein